MHPNTFPSSAHDTGMLEVRQMSRKFRLRGIQNGHQIADAKLPLKKKHHDSKASLIREGAKEGHQRFHFNIQYLFMRIFKYIREEEITCQW